MMEYLEENQTRHGQYANRTCVLYTNLYVRSV
jgi:hypothetical protein